MWAKLYEIVDIYTKLWFVHTAMFTIKIKWDTQLNQHLQNVKI